MPQSTDTEEGRKIYLTWAWEKAHQLLSHKDRDVRDLAIFSISMMKEMFPEDMLVKK